MKIKPKVKKYPGGGKIKQLSDFTPVFHNSNETIQQKIKNQNEYQQTDAYTKQLALKAVQDAEEANRKKYVPSQAVKNTKALNAVAQLIQPYNPYFKAIGTGGDIETAIKYGIDGQYDKMKEDLVQAGLQWIPFMKGSPAMKQGTYNLSTLQNLFNFGLSTTQKGSDAKTVTEVFKNGGSINKYPNGGKPPKYEWSKGIDNIQPITQTQNNSSITTGNKKLSTEELKKAAEYTKKYNQQHLEEEYNNRQNKLKQSIDAQKQPLSLKNLQTQTQSTGDKVSLAMNSKYGNPKDYPTLSGYMQGLDYINPAKMIGDMASGLGSVPQDIKEGNYLRAGLSVASPLAVGAIAGVGANSVKPFVNNLVNPLAGTGEVINNLGNKYLPNAYKLNPYAFKPNSEMMYRGIGKEGMEDALESGVFRAKQNVAPIMDETGRFDMSKQFQGTYYSPKFNTADQYGAGYIAEVPKDVTNFRLRYKGKGNKTWSQIADENIPIDKGKILKKDWLQGYKPIEIPKSNFKSEINWRQWNKEIPENTQLMQEYNAIDYGKNPLSDKEKEMYRWFEKQQKLDALPKTTNKKTLGVLEDFKTRIQTPEGKKRMKELGIDSDKMLQKIQIVEDPNTFGYFSGDRNRVVLNPLDPLPTQTARHEIEHGVQNAFQNQAIKNEGKIIPTLKRLVTDPLLKKPLPKSITDANTKIDDLLSGLELRKQGTPNKQWIGHVEQDSPVDISEYKSLISNKQNATDYFLTGSEGREKSAFLGEVQQYMMDTGKIPKDSYTKITPEMVKETMVDAMFDEAGGGKYLRLFNIIKADSKNYEIISKSLNKMLSISPLIGAGAYMQNKEYKNGGALGNNGMFDMTNPNIYKALVPGVIGLGAASQIDKKEFGGNITKESEWELVNEDLPKAGNGLSLVKTLTPIGNKVIPRNPSLYKDAINNVDKIEHNINDRYRVQADDFTDKNYPTDYDEDSGHNDYVDALRHSATAMYTTSGQGNFLAPLKVPYTNVMGLAHELKGLGSYVSNPDKLTWQGAKQQLRETGSDLYNNFVGSMIGGLPINIENKEKILKFAKDKNILSDLSKKQNGGKLPKRRLNLNKSSDWEIVD